jgi:hypothetical protein
MKTEVYIEDFLLDQSDDLSSLLTLMIDDIKDFSTRTTTFSKTIVLPGTTNNNRLLGNIFQFAQANDYDATQPNVGYNFNAAKSAPCIIFQDNIQTFKGGLRLLEIDIDKGRYEYQIAVFGDMAALNSALGSALLEDLDFSAYNHVLSDTAIINSWDNTPGSGYYYPLIDYGKYSVAKHDWDYHTFRPGLYVKEYIDKMFSAAGFIYESALFETERFKRLIIPHNQKVLTSKTSLLLTATNSTDELVIDYATTASRLLKFDTVVTSIFTPDFSPASTFTYNGTDPVTMNINFDIEYNWKCTNNFITISIRKNGADFATHVAPNTGGFLVTFGSWVGSVPVSLVTGDVIDFLVIVSDSSAGHQYTFVFKTLNSFVNFKTSSDVPVPVNLGGDVKLNDTIPRNIKQIDFLVSLVKLFNLYVYEDKFQKNKIYITPYIDFYGHDDTASDDWTYKLNRDKQIKIKPMSELTSQIYNFKYKSDTDYYNDLYSKRYNQNYGDYIFNSNFEFTSDKTDTQIIFSSTPLVGYAGEDKVQGTIFKLSGTTEDNTDSNIRIMQTKKISGIGSWSLLDGGTVLDTLTSYGYAGHFDDPDSPTNDLNFGALQELFFTLATGFLSNTQFNLYWSAYMAEIIHKDSKLVTGYFYLKPQDILDLDFSRYKYLDGVLFRLSKITDFNMSQPGDCEVQLLKVIFTQY